MGNYPSKKLLVTLITKKKSFWPSYSPLLIERVNMEDLYLPININIRTNLVRNKKSCTSYQFQQEYRKLVESSYLNYNKIFTDGSKTSAGCGCAYFVDINPPITVRKRLPPTCGIFNAELYAILLAVRFICESNLDNFVIFTDSYSALQFLKNPKLDHWIKNLIHKALRSCNKTIIFEWISSHSGIQGNEAADVAAKESISSNIITNIPIMYNDYKFLVKSLINRQWQMLWSETHCRLKDFKPIIGDWKSSYRENRMEEKILSRLRTGSAYFLYQHKLDRHRLREREFCNSCDIAMSIEHLLISCPDFQYARNIISSHLNRLNLPLTEGNILSDDFNHNLLFNFRKEVNFYKKC